MNSPYLERELYIEPQIYFKLLSQKTEEKNLKIFKFIHKMIVNVS